MQVNGFCSPERFNTLQQIFDDVWAELERRQNGSMPEAAAIRSRLAAMVMDLKDAPELHVELAKQELLRLLEGDATEPPSGKCFSGKALLDHR
jgi:hypothetical protein